MKTNSLLALTAILSVSTLGGCKMTAYETGFLSNYSKLRNHDGVLRYVDDAEIKDYSSFIVDPVVFRSHTGAKPTDPKVVEAVTSAFHKDVVTKLEAAHYTVVHARGPGVARLRIAITDIDKSNPVLNIIPQTHLIGCGIGGVSMEAELVDSRSGKQIAAVVEGKRGSRMSFAGMTSREGDAKAVCAGWADAFVKRVNKDHGR